MVPNLELIIRAMHVVKSRNQAGVDKKACEEDEYDVTVPSLLDMTKEALVGRPDTDATPKHKKKVMTKRQEQKMAAISLKRERGTSSAIHKLLLENISLSQILSTMNLKRLKKAALVLMSKIVELLVSISQVTTQNKNTSRSVSNLSDPLNKRKGVLKASWKKMAKGEGGDANLEFSCANKRWK